MTTATVIVSGLPTSTIAREPQRVARRVSLKPVRHLTRAHLALAQRPQVVNDALSIRDAVCAHLAEQLSVPVALTGKLADATLHPASHLASRGVFAIIELNADALGLLELDPVCIAALLQHAAGSPANAAGAVQLTRIEEAALGWLLLTSLASLRSITTVAAHYLPRLVSMHQSRVEALAQLDTRRRHLAVGLDLSIGEQRCGGRLLLPTTWFELVLKTLPATPPGSMHEAVAQANLEATCMLGLMSVAREDAASFAPGDVLVFPGVGHGTRLTGPARLMTRTFELRGAFGADGFTLTDALPCPPELTMSQFQDDPTLPVDVEIELTRLRIPLHQLGLLKPGAVLPLHINVAQSVVVRVGDRAVARAELVEVEGEVGARIISMI